MVAAHTTDLNLSQKDISALTSANAVAAFLSALRYDTSARKALTAEAIGLSGEAAAPIKRIELLSEDPEGFLRVVFVELRSLTARSRLDLARVLGRANVDHLLILTSDFSTIELVLLDKRRRDHRGPGGIQRIQVVPLVFAVARKAAGSRELRTVRRLTWTRRDGLEQFDKLRSVFEAAAFSEDYFCNRALFADHYLLTRLREDAAWVENTPSRLARPYRSSTTTSAVALAIDRLARDPDDKTFKLVPIDYKSLEVRHLGSIYEGLLEFKLRLADEDLTTHTERTIQQTACFPMRS